MGLWSPCLVGGDTFQSLSVIITILPQFKLGLAMPPEKKVDGVSRERVLSRRFLKAAHVGGSEAAGGKRRGGRGEGAGTASEKGERGGDASQARRGEGERGDARRGGART